MSEGTTKFQKFVNGTTAFWQRHKPRAGSTGVLVGGLIGSAGTTTKIIDKGIRGEPMNLWHAAELLFWFVIACAKSWELWNQPPPPPRSTTAGVDPEGHLK